MRHLEYKVVMPAPVAKQNRYPVGDSPIDPVEGAALNNSLGESRLEHRAHLDRRDNILLLHSVDKRRI